MNKAHLLNKIDSLPNIVQTQVFDFVDFLVEKYKIGETSTDLTKKEKIELDARFDDYIINPSTAMDLDSFKEKMLKKHGL